MAALRVRLAPGDVDYRCGPEALDDAEVIALCVKSGDTAAAADQIVKHADQGTTIISFQNGVSNIDVLEQGLGGRFVGARKIGPRQRRWQAHQLVELPTVLDGELDREALAIDVVKQVRAALDRRR